MCENQTVRMFIPRGQPYKKMSRGETLSSGIVIGAGDISGYGRVSVCRDPHGTFYIEYCASTHEDIFLEGKAGDEVVLTEISTIGLRPGLYVRIDPDTKRSLPTHDQDLLVIGLAERKERGHLYVIAHPHVFPGKRISSSFQLLHFPTEFDLRKYRHLDDFPFPFPFSPQY